MSCILCLLFFSKVFFKECLVFLSCCMYKQTNYSKNKKTFEINNNKYSSSSQSLRDIYSWSSGGLDVLYFVVLCVFSRRFCVCLVYPLFCLCFCIVFLSFCLNTTQYTTLNTNKHEMGLFMTCVKCSK